MTKLSAKEQNLVSKYSKKNRPTYYSSAQNKDVSISEEMEAFIILAPPESRNAVVTWANKAIKKTDATSTRNSLLNECLTFENADATAQIEELDKELADYDQFRSKYYTNIFPENAPPDNKNPSVLPSKQTRFGAVPEVGQAMNDLSLTVSEVLSIRDRAKHLQVMCSVLTTKLTVSDISKAQKQEIASWATPFSAYDNKDK